MYVFQEANKNASDLNNKLFMYITHTSLLRKGNEQVSISVTL